MEETPATQANLLVRIRDGHDHAAWQQFLQVFAPVVYWYARNRGLQDADAADLVQAVFRSIAGAIGRWNYDPARGTFRGWLFTITRNKIYRFLEARQRRGIGSCDADVQELLKTQAALDNEEELWDREYERRVFAWAADEVRGQFTGQTYQAFWQTAVEGRNPSEVGRTLDISVGAVYVAKSRVLARLLEQVHQFQEEQTFGSKVPVEIQAGPAQSLRGRANRSVGPRPRGSSPCRHVSLMTRDEGQLSGLDKEIHNEYHSQAEAAGLP